MLCDTCYWREALWVFCQKAAWKLPERKSFYTHAHKHESVRTHTHVLGIVGSLMIIWTPLSHPSATCMITRQEPIFQTPASSVIRNPCSQDWGLPWQMLFTADALFLWLHLSGQFFAWAKLKKIKNPHKWPHEFPFSASYCISYGH